MNTLYLGDNLPINTNKKPENYAFIDGQNIETGLQIQGLEILYQELFDYLTTKYKVKKVYYCSKYSNYSLRLQFFENLKKIGYEMIFSSGVGNGRDDGSHKVNVDADLIVKCLTDYFLVEKFGLVLLSGDGDFVPLIRFFEQQKQFVKIISPSKIATSKMLSFDRFTTKRRFLTYLCEELPKLTKKISPRREWRD
jgi:uncharacterized LabA/DUF88 family protein